MITLYDYALSGSCYKVRLLLSMLELEYETIPVDYYPGKAHRKPDFLALNPLGQLPVLEDGELRLRDAQAILVYLASKYDAAGSWLPRSPELLGQVQMWLAFAGGELMNSSAARMIAMLGYEGDIESARAKSHAALRVLDDHLVERQILGHTWLTGDQATVADIACFPYVALAGDGGVILDDYCAIRLWLNAVKGLPGYLDIPGVHPLQ